MYLKFLYKILLTFTMAGIMSCRMNTIPNIKIAIPFTLAKEPFDPAKVLNTQDANIVRTLYSNLIEYDSAGKIILGLADSYEIKENQMVFNLGKRGIFSNGDKITGYDVEATIFRILKLKLGTHSDIERLLCNGKFEITKTCAGIEANTEKLVLTIDPKSNIELLINALASHDLRIIPQKALDKNLNISREDITSGLYSVINKNLETNELKCKINKNNFRYNEKNPPELIFKYVPASTEFELLKNGEIDMIPTFYITSYDEYLKRKDQFSTYETNQIKLYYLQPDQPRGYKDLENEERLKLGLIIRKMAIANIPSYRYYKISNSFFPNFSEASLSESDQNEVNNLFTKLENSQINKNVIFRANNENTAYLKKAKHIAPNIELQDFTILYKDLKKVDLPHMYFESIDTTFYDTESVILYTLKIDMFGFGENENKVLIEKISNKSKEERIKVIKEIHKRILTEGRVVPIAHAPYFAIANKKWKLEFSKYFAGSPVWGITYQGE